MILYGLMKMAPFAVLAAIVMANHLLWVKPLLKIITIPPAILSPTSFIISLGATFFESTLFFIVVGLIKPYYYSKKTP